jgi:CRISPR system Cascade subunit CasE
MSAPGWLTRVALSRSASARALVQLLAPREPNQRAQSSHRLLWTLFADTAERQRDFLWREESPGRFTILSARPPQDSHSLFDPYEAKPFEPDFHVGDHLRFTLRVNATVRHRGDPKHRDVVMDAIHALPAGERAVPRRQAEQAASRTWLDAQGAAHGFSVRDMACLGYETLDIPRPPQRDLRLGVLELEGVLCVTDPAAVVAKLRSGFGRARAFGCGLMLVHRTN